MKEPIFTEAQIGMMFEFLKEIASGSVCDWCLQGETGCAGCKLAQELLAEIEAAQPEAQAAQLKIS